MNTWPWWPDGHQWATSTQSIHCNIFIYTVRLFVNVLVYKYVEGIGKIPLKKDAGADETMVFKTYEPEKVYILAYNQKQYAYFEMP